MLKLKRSKIKQLYKKYENLLDNKDIIILCDNFENAINVGSIFRLAEAVNAKVILTGRSPTPDKNKYISITSKDNENKVEWDYIKNIDEAYYKLKYEYQIVSIELTSNAKIYTDVKIKNKVCFVLGAENNGVSEFILKNSDEVIFIPMFGKGYSLNVTMAAGIVIYNYIFI